MGSYEWGAIFQEFQGFAASRINFKAHPDGTLRLQDLGTRMDVSESSNYVLYYTYLLAFRIVTKAAEMLLTVASTYLKRDR